MILLNISERWRTNVCDLNKYCNISNLISYYKTCVLRAFYEAVLSYFLLQTFILFTPTFFNELPKGDENSLAALMLLPLFVLAVVCLLYISKFIINVGRKINEINSIVEKCKLPLSYMGFENELTKLLKRTHFEGIMWYYVLSLFTSLLHLKLFNGRLTGNPFAFMIIITFIGGVLGSLWNFCDYLSDKRVDWGYIIKGLTPAVKHKNNIIISIKFKYSLIHTIILILSSIIVIGLAIVCFILGSGGLGIKSDFFGNAYVLFFSTICILYFKSCYASYFIEEQPDKKVYIHVSEFVRSDFQNF